MILKPSFIITTFLILVSCKKVEKPSIIGKWKILPDSTYRRPGYNIYDIFDSNRVTVERVNIESRPYEMHGDTMIMNMQSDSSQRDSVILKMISNDSASISSLKGVTYYYIVREKELSKY